MNKKHEIEVLQEELKKKYDNIKQLEEKNKLILATAFKRAGQMIELKAMVDSLQKENIILKEKMANKKKGKRAKQCTST